jgi:hypothetical protein
MGRPTKPFVQSNSKNKKLKIKSLLHAMNLQAIPVSTSPLHSWLRFFQCLHHIFHRLDIKNGKLEVQVAKKTLKR